MKKFIFFSLIFLLFISSVYATGVNPATEHCIKLDYEHKIVDTELGQEGICVFSDSIECEEWDFYEGNCGQEYSYCTKNGHDLIVKDDGQNPFSREYYVCAENGTELNAVNELMGISITRRENNETFDEWWRTNHTQKLDNPDSFDWRDYNGHNWLTPIKNQGDCGGCWAFSSVGVVEAAYNIHSNNPNLDLDLSERYLLSDCANKTGKDGCEGGQSFEALKFIRDLGIPDEECLSYGTNNCSELCSDWQERLTRIDKVETYWAGNRIFPEEIKKNLTENGPLVSSIWLGAGGYWDKDIYKCKRPVSAMHAVIIVGYNNTGEYWLVKNSYGTGFEDDGYFKVGYGECYIDSGYKITTVGFIEEKEEKESYNWWKLIIKLFRSIF